MVTQRRLPAVDGQPSVNAPPRLDLALVQQQVNHIRDRLAKLDGAINRAFVILDASRAPTEAAALSQQVIALQRQVEALSVLLLQLSTTAEADEGPLTTPLDALVAELTKVVHDLQVQPPSSLAAEVEELRKLLEDVQHQPGDAMMGMLVELTKRVDGIEQGQLV